jgi:hypothetical protein
MRNYHKSNEAKQIMKELQEHAVYEPPLFVESFNSEVVLQFMHTLRTQLQSILPTWRAAYQKQLCYCPPHFADCQHNWQTDHNSVTCRTFTDAEPIYILQNFHSDSIYKHKSTSAVYTPLPSQSLCHSFEPVSF